VEQAQAGIPVPPGDPASLAEAVLQLADNPAEAVRMGSRGRQYVEQHFDRSILARQLARLLINLVEKS
jgi:glycosyltransferase involved in cell wall biosynthesis